jgi:hypothetical protein
MGCMIAEASGHRCTDGHQVAQACMHGERTGSWSGAGCCKKAKLYCLYSMFIKKLFFILYTHNYSADVRIDVV